jgi:hypothetical protein
VPPLPPTPSTVPQVKAAPARNKWPFVALAVVAVLAVVVVVIVLVTRKSDDSDQSTGAKVTPPPTTTHSVQTTSTSMAATTTVPSTVPAAPLAPQVFSGTGNNTLTIQHPTSGGQMIAGIGYTGTGTFTVSSAAAGTTDQQLVNATGFYLGRHVVGPTDDQLVVSGTGPWQITVDPASTDRGWASGAISGTGDDVVVWQGTTTANATVHSAGPGSFVVKVNGSALVTQTAPFDGQVQLPAGPAVVEVTANGQAWSITTA